GGAARGTWERGGPLSAAGDGDGWRLEGAAPPTDKATRVAGFLVEARAESGSVTLLVGRDTPGVRLGEPLATLGLRGVDPCAVAFAGARLAARDVHGSPGRGDEPIAAALALARLGAAATADGQRRRAPRARRRARPRVTPPGGGRSRMAIAFEALAIAGAALFAAWALYVSLVEHPARMETGPAAARIAFRSSYRRAAPWQAAFASLTFASGLAAALVTSAWAWALGGVVVGAAVPFTLLVVMPTTRRLLASACGLVVLLLAAHLR